MDVGVGVSWGGPLPGAAGPEGLPIGSGSPANATPAVSRAASSKKKSIRAKDNNHQLLLSVFTRFMSTPAFSAALSTCNQNA